MLSVPPERLEQFSLELKQSIKDKKSKKSKASHKYNKSKRSNKKYHKKDKSSSSKSIKSKSVFYSKRKSSNDRKSHKKRKKSNSEPENLTDESDIEENGLDLTKELHPLSHYVKDRQVLSEILFSIVKGTKLTAMLPDILKDIPLEELKQKCFSHLEVMSSKRIIHIITGEPMQSSSGTDSDDEHNVLSENNEAVAKEEASKSSSTDKTDENNLQANFVDSTTSSGCEVLSLLAAGSEPVTSVSEDKVLPQEYSDSKAADKNSLVSFSPKVEEPASSTFSDHPDLIQAELSDIEEEIETVEIVEDVEYADMVDAMLEERLAPDNQDSSAEGLSKSTANNAIKTQNEGSLSQLELLELQLRARAIKSLMKAVNPNNDSTKT